MRRHRVSILLVVAVALTTAGLLSAGSASAHSCKSMSGYFALHVAGAPCPAGREVQRAYSETDCCHRSYVVYAYSTTWLCRWRILKHGKQNPYGDQRVIGQVKCRNRRHSARVLWKYSGGGARR